MADIVEQVQEREAAHVSPPRGQGGEGPGPVRANPGLSRPSLWLLSDERRSVPALQQPLSSTHSLRWATAGKRPPKTKEEAPPEGARGGAAVALGSRYRCPDNPAAAVTHCPERRLPVPEESHHL